MLDDIRIGHVNFVLFVYFLRTATGGIGALGLSICTENMFKLMSSVMMCYTCIYLPK